jgi:hypothetical protein
MSEYWELYCRDHDDYSSRIEINHGEKQVALICKHVKTLALIHTMSQEADFPGDVMVVIGYQSHADLNWCHTHKDCNVCPRSEYGRLYVDGEYIETSDYHVRRFQVSHGLKPSGWIGLKSGDAIFENRMWPDGCYFDLDMGAYFIP